MTNTKREKQNTSILFLSNSFASSLVPVWQPTDRPTDKRKVFFIGSCAQPVVRISLEFKIQSKRNTNYKKLEFEIQNTKIQNNDIYNENTKFKTICSCAQPDVRISLEFEIQNTRNTKYKKLKFEIQNKRLIFIWENGISFFAQLCPDVTGSRLPSKNERFFGPKIRILAEKSALCYRTPDFINSPFVALGKTVDFAPSDQFFNFLFLRNGRFVEKKTCRRTKESSPTRLWGQ